MGIANLDALDEQILKLIADNARIPFLEVARACHVSGAAIHQRIQKLTRLGVLKGSQYVLDPERIGYETCAYVGLFLKDPSDFDRVVEELRNIPKWWNVIIQLVIMTCLSKSTPGTTTTC